MRQYILRAWDILTREGPAVLLDRAWLRVKRWFGSDSPGNFDLGYRRFQRESATIDAHSAAELIHGLDRQFGFSIILPVYRVDTQWLERAVQSVLNQLYPKWQLCIVDDASGDSRIDNLLQQFEDSDSRISIRRNPENLGIGGASRAALEMVGEDYLVLLDHDDELTADALLHCAVALDRDSELDLIYSDEDKIDAHGHCHTPFFKPDFSPTLLMGQNYIGHLVVARADLVRKVGGFQVGFDGSQDYDLLLRLCESTRRIHHIPRVLYHWREVPGSTALAFNSKSWAWDAGKKALEQHFERTESCATVTLGEDPGTYHVDYAIRAQPLVSVILPFRDQPRLLDRCLHSLFGKSRWERLEVIAIDNNSEQDETRAVVDKWARRDPRFKHHGYNQPFNFSAICNHGVEQASGEFLVLLNSDIEMVSENWVETLLSHAGRPQVGAVGAKLLYPDHTIQHAGIVVGIDNGAGHPYKNFPAAHRGYFQRLRLAHNVSAVSAALLMVARQKYMDAGGLDETELAIAYNDVDFCLKLVQAGYHNVLNPNCVAIHHESATRGYEHDQQRRQRHHREKEILRRRWPHYFDSGDPMYNANLTLKREDYTLKFDR